MRTISRLMIGLLAMVGLHSSLAVAADLPARTPPLTIFQAVETGPIWTGFYVGLTAGAALSDSHRARVSYEDGSAFPGSVSNRSRTGATVGGTIGYNYQVGSFVLGVEGDYSYLGLKNTTRLTYANNANGLSPVTYRADGSIRNSIDSYGTVRGRVGYLVTPSLLLYGTGGVTFADVNTRAAITEGVTYNGSSTPFAAYSGHRSGFRTGFAYGGGAEYKVSDHWSVKVEALRVQLPASRLYAGNDTAFGYNVRKIANDFTVVRAGVNYNF